MIRQALRGARDASTRRPPELPAMTIHVETGLPAWVLRAIAGAAVAVCGLLLATGPVTVAMVLLAVAFVVLLPETGLPAVVLAFYGYLYIIADPHQGVAAVLLLGLHLMLTLTRLVGSVGPRASVEVAALIRVGRGFVVFQVFAQVVLHLAMGLPTLGGVVWLGVGALAGLLALTVIMVRALRQVA